MPRNLTDLPLNDDPQDTDWLLGASGISPAVFQKIPVGLVKAPVGAGGGSIFVPINEPTALTEGGLFFTDTLASNLLVTFDNPPVGTYIRWLNYSSKSVVLDGFTTADGVTIPTDKGISIAIGEFLEGFVNTAGNFKKLSGNYAIYWLPGKEPAAWNPLYEDSLLMWIDPNQSSEWSLSANNIISFKEKTGLTITKVGSGNTLLITNGWGTRKTISNSGDSNFLNFSSSLNNARTIVAVVKFNTNSTYGTLLGHHSFYDFHPGLSTILDNGYVADAVKNGSGFLNGNVYTPGNLPKPLNFSIISFVATGDARLSNLFNDRNIPARYFNGQIIDFIVFKESSVSLAQKAEGLLADSLWVTNGMTTPLPTTHPYYSYPPS